MIVNDVE